MRLIKKFLAVSVLFTSITATAAHAGPPVTVSFRNDSGLDASYKIVTDGELDTYTNASPKPVKTVQAKGADSYVVTNPLSPDMNFAYVRYVIGKEECQFRTAFFNLPNGPRWTKSTTSSSYAICTAEITQIDANTHAWMVEFSMKVR